MAEVEALLELADLRGERLRVGDIAREHLDRHRAAIGGAQQAIDDLQLALLAVPVVAQARERAATAFEIARRHVVKHQRVAPQVAPGERGLDRRLAGEQPVERRIQLVLGDLLQPEHRAQAGGGGRGSERLGGRQLRGRGEDAADDQGDRELAAALAGRAEQAVEADLAQRAEHGGDVTMRQRADDAQRCLPGRDDGAALEQGTQPFDQLARPVGQIEQGPLSDPVAVAIALAQQDRRRRRAVRHSLDIHGRMIDLWIAKINMKNVNYMDTYLSTVTDIYGKINSSNPPPVGSSA